ncbi:MAG TPA: epimerase [Thermoplasmata archaeon]
MKVILFGASGMVGQGVLRECLLDPGVELVVSIGRRSTGAADGKLRVFVQPDLADLSGVEDQLRGFDACFFPLGVTSAGMTEAEYRHVTYDLTVDVGTTLARLNPELTFVYVSGAGTDSTEHGRAMWARVKGATENALLRLPIHGAYMFRPGLIRPLHGIRSKTRLYRISYTLLWPLMPLLSALLPNYITTTEKVGRAMIRVAREGSPRKILNAREINALGTG